MPRKFDPVTFAFGSNQDLLRDHSVEALFNHLPLPHMSIAAFRRDPFPMETAAHQAFKRELRPKTKHGQTNAFNRTRFGTVPLLYRTEDRYSLLTFAMFNLAEPTPFRTSGCNHHLQPRLPRRLGNVALRTHALQDLRLYWPPSSIRPSCRCCTLRCSGQ